MFLQIMWDRYFFANLHDQRYSRKVKKNYLETIFTTLQKTRKKQEKNNLKF